VIGMPGWRELLAQGTERSTAITEWAKGLGGQTDTVSRNVAELQKLEQVISSDMDAAKALKVKDVTKPTVIPGIGKSLVRKGAFKAHLRGDAQMVAIPRHGNAKYNRLMYTDGTSRSIGRATGRAVDLVPLSEARVKHGAITKDLLNKGGKIEGGLLDRSSTAWNYRGPTTEIQYNAAGKVTGVTESAVDSRLHLISEATVQDTAKGFKATSVEDLRGLKPVGKLAGAAKGLSIAGNLIEIGGEALEGDEWGVVGATMDAGLYATGIGAVINTVWSFGTLGIGHVLGDEELMGKGVFGTAEYILTGD